jgi:hypothetical protein
MKLVRSGHDGNLRAACAVLFDPGTPQKDPAHILSYDAWPAVLHILFGACYTAPAKKDSRTDTGAISIRDIPRELLVGVKMAAALEKPKPSCPHCRERIEELEKKGLLPKGK